MRAGNMNECDILKRSEFVPNSQLKFTLKKRKNQRRDIFTIVIGTREISETDGIVYIIIKMMIFIKKHGNKLHNSVKLKTMVKYI